MSKVEDKSPKPDTSDEKDKSPKPDTSDEKDKSPKSNTSQDESKLDKVLGSLEKVIGLLEMTERGIPLVSGKTRWEPVLTRGFQSDDLKQVEKFFLSLGLGRGVDVTCTKPFHNKTAFQIKQVKYDKLIGTDEGGLLVDFTDTVYSTTDTSVKYQASLDVMKALGKHAGPLAGPLAAVSAPFRFTASGELSRNEYSIGVVLGVRILNRTVSFKQTIDSVPTSLDQGAYLEGLNVISVVEFRNEFSRRVWDRLDKTAKEDIKKEQEKEETFEKKLTNWILEYNKKATKPEESSKGKAATGDKNKLPLEDIDSDTLDTLCEAYTRSTGVTHYVSSIKLGAEMYKTMDLQAYQSTFKSNASVNVLDIFTAGDDDPVSGTRVQRKNIDKKYATKVIGRITEEKQPKATKTVPNPAPTVSTDDNKGPKEEALNVRPRKSYKVDPRDEAVIGYELRSVASLIVDDERLAKKMALAARKYIEEKRGEKGEALWLMIVLPLALTVEIMYT